MADKGSILITGASGKLGSTLLKHFLQQGHRVIALTARAASLEALLQEHQPYWNSKRLFGLAVDLCEADAVDQVIQFLQELGESPECLINNARRLDTLKVGEQGLVSNEDFSLEFQLGVSVPYELTRKLAAPSQSRLRSVVNVASMYGIVAVNPHLYDAPPNDAALHYGVVKAAMIHLTKELAVRLAPQRIRVNAVSFGGVEGRVDDGFKERYAKLCPMQRMLTDKEVCGPIEFLLSEASSSMTGHNLVADGGWSTW